MPPLYKHYSQSALNRQYNNRLQTPDFAVYLEWYERSSREIENIVKFEKDIPYGTHPREKLDIFPGKDQNSPIVVFIHGGYWKSFDKSSFRFIAPAFLPEATVVCLNYPLAPESSMDQIVSSCEKALVWITEKYKGDIYIVGHSAGAHLAAMLLTKEVGQKVKRMLGLSGIYNLIPLQLSDLNDTLKMDESMATRNSPSLLENTHSIPILLAVGEDETEEFKAQTEELKAAWKRTISIEINNANHFSIVDPSLSIFKDLICK